jgi:hypothetical protein
MTNKTYITFDNYIKLLNIIRANKKIPDIYVTNPNEKLEEKKNLNTTNYEINIDESSYKLFFFKQTNNVSFNVFDELSKYVTSIISRSKSVDTIYDLFSEKVSKKLKENNISDNEFIAYVKGSLIFRNKIEKFVDKISNQSTSALIKNIICYNKNYCVNPILNESDFDVNIVIFNNNFKSREVIKNIILNTLIEIKEEIDTNVIYQKWVESINKNIYDSILQSISNNKVNESIDSSIKSILTKTIVDKDVSKKKMRKKKLRKTLKKILNKTIKRVKQIKNNQQNKKTLKNNQNLMITGGAKNKINNTYSSELEDRSIDELFAKKKLKFANYDKMIKLLKDVDQSRTSFYINNLKNSNYSFQSEIVNFNHLDKQLSNKNLKKTQSFITMNENINMNLKNKLFERKIHFDLYRLKLNFSFFMKYSNSNIFKKNIGGEVIDISFPYQDNAYFNKEGDYYEEKIMVSQTYKGLYEFNGWGILNDLVETIEIESINISKPHKFEKRINRFIFIRFLEYWLRIPFRLNLNQSERTFFIYNNFIKLYGTNFNTFFNKTSYKDFEFQRIQKCLSENQNIDIFKLYRKFLRQEPYQTLFKMSREELDDAIGIKPNDIKSLKTLLTNHKDIYSIFFDIKLYSTVYFK